MTIREIKRQLGVRELNFKYQLDAEGNKTDFLRAWDNGTRTEVIMHNNVAEEIQEALFREEHLDTLSLQDKGVKGFRISTVGLEYKKYFIVIYNDKPDYSF
jgi:hypothetical protein